MSEWLLIERLCAFLINQVIFDWETHSLSSFQSTSTSTLQLSRLISWQVLQFYSIVVWISIYSWFVWFSTIIWFWIEITSSIEFWLAFDLSFKSESDLDWLQLIADRICFLTIASDADIAFNYHSLQLTWR